ncbi:MAG: sodium-dependent bicarbonate transport family permease [Thermoanaerobaculia bacterium]|nr:sodium-dependent bicarbonate transport family permease [Thermoanaerobaculia bacterium]
MIDVVVFFFLLGVFARLIKSELRLPEALYEVLSIYLLLAIGLKGGVELSKQPLLVLLPQVVVTVLLSFSIPLVLYPCFRLLRLPSWDSAALGAHFGSVSIVTFAVVTSTLTRTGIGFESHAALWAALMEAPGLVAGVLLARVFGRTAEGRPTAGIRWGPLLHEVLFGKSVLLLLGGLAIGALAGVEGVAPIKAVFVEPFKGLLALFLLDLGLLAGGRLPEVRRFGWLAIVIGVGVPPILAVAGALAGAGLGLSAGGIAVLATLAATASYIAAPAAMRLSVPQANPALSITIALGITFPFNLVIGIPLYIRLGAALAA